MHDAAYNQRLDEINEHSVAEGLERTAGIITAAGLIMIVVFGAFAMGHVLVVKELGVGLAMAVLLDSTIIRVDLGAGLDEADGPPELVDAEVRWPGSPTSREPASEDEEDEHHW